MYAARIHDLGCPPTLADIQLETWEVIASRLHGAPLFPRLQHLEITVSLWYASGLLLLLSPSIRFLRVSLERETSLDWSEFVHFLVKSTFGNTLIQSTSRSPAHLQHSEQLWATSPKATAHFRAATASPEAEATHSQTLVNSGSDRAFCWGRVWSIPSVLLPTGTGRIIFKRSN